MSRSVLWRFLQILTIVGVCVVLVAEVRMAYKLYSSIFRLSETDIRTALSDTTAVPCEKIPTCPILPGDILIRRYITKRTQLIDMLAHPYFTHAAFYIGDNKLVEAMGTEEYQVDDIQITTLSKSDWQDSGIESFVVIRPTYTASQLDSIKRNLENIANDPDYIFGLPKKGSKTAMCADLIFNQLVSHGLITEKKIPTIVTPDYLFTVAIRDKVYFKIIWYNLNSTPKSNSI